MSESIVQKQPPVQSNPFAKHLADHVNAGAVAIESERAIAEAQGKLVIAKRFPRDQARAYSAIIDACKRPGLAEEACYSFPRGGQTVSGPSIRLAEMLAANWGNIDYGIRELSRKEGVSEMEAYCWDLETNTMSSQKFTVRHIRDTRGGGVKLTDERDIYELTANMGGRRLRARILAIIPADLVQAAVDECSKTMAGGAELPIGDRIRNMVTAFKALGVTPELIEKKVGHKLDAMTGEELADLRKIHNSIRDGVSKIGDWFGDKPAGEDEQMPGDPQPQDRAPVPERKKRQPKGAQAIDAEVVTEAAPVERESTKTNGAGMVVADEAKNAALVDKLSEQARQNTAKPVESFTEAAAATDTSEKAQASTESPKPRAFLQDKEEITAVVTVASLSPRNIITLDPDGQKTPKPSVAAKLSGGYVGEVYHIGGGVADGATVKPAAPWAVGAVLNVKLLGKLNSKVNKVQTFVQSVAVAQQAGTEVMEA